MEKTHYIIPIFVPDLGCPHQCVFCSQKKITGHQLAPTPEQVRHTIAKYLTTIPDGPGIFREAAFFGGSFTAIDPNFQRQLLAPAHDALVRGQLNGIRVSTRPDAVTEEGLMLLSVYGVGTVEIGVQSMDDQVLHLAGRGHSSRDVLRAAALIKSWGLRMGVQMMVGLPGDDAEKDLHSALELIGLRPEMARIYPCLVLRETPLAELYRQGRYRPLSLEEAADRCKTLLLLFEQAGVRVIRIGLQPTDQINLGGEVIAGPFHPAFRELVESAAARDMLTCLLRGGAGVKKARRMEVAVPGRDVSIVRGHGGRNVKYLKEAFGITELVTTADSSLNKGEIRLVQIDDRAYHLTMRRQDLLQVRS